MPHHAAELHWMTEADIHAVVGWLERHLQEVREVKADAERQGNTWLADRCSIECLLLSRLQNEAAAVLGARDG